MELIIITLDPITDAEKSRSKINNSPLFFISKEGYVWITFEGKAYSSQILPILKMAATSMKSMFTTFGILTNNCLMCNKPLKDAFSVENGIGPVCRSKFEKALIQSQMVLDELSGTVSKSSVVRKMSKPKKRKEIKKNGSKKANPKISNNNNVDDGKLEEDDQMKPIDDYDVSTDEYDSEEEKEREPKQRYDPNKIIMNKTTLLKKQKRKLEEPVEKSEESDNKKFKMKFKDGKWKKIEIE